MNYHPAFPLRIDLHIERRAEQIAAADSIAARQMRATLQATRAQIAALRFECGSPIEGYDIKDVLALLDDITPTGDAEMDRRIEAAAQDRAAEDVMARAYDAADLRRDERRMGA